MEARALYSREVEEAFVGALLLDGDLAKECTIKPGQLYMSRLRVLLAAIQRLCKKGSRSTRCPSSRKSAWTMWRVSAASAM